MKIIKKNLFLEQVLDEVELVFAPENVQITTLEKALKDEGITDEELKFLNKNKYKRLIIGESTVFALDKNGFWVELFTPYR